ncbi:MAG: SDR family NAD(P)-dependent oxidoreductase [Thermodesulfobacteriota bacterium]
MPEARFAGRVCVVTGAGSGLGRATALRLAREGACVAALDVDREAAERTASDAAAAGGVARAFRVDVADPRSVRAAVDGLVAALGRPQVLVNCAGIGKFANTHEMPFEEWSRIIAVNLTGTFLMAQAVLPHLLDGGGNIVNVASNAGVGGAPYSAAYCASKGGVVNLTRALADEYIKRGVRVNAVAPGGIATPLQDHFRTLPPGADPTLLAKIRSPLGNAQPDEIASLIAYVASDDARYMTGSIVSIDGGITT